jgi:hypothetical protein
MLGQASLFGKGKKGKRKGAVAAVPAGAAPAPGGRAVGDGRAAEEAKP